MAKDKTPKPMKAKKRIVMSNMVDWAIIDKKINKAVGVFNPQGNTASLRRVAVKTAIKHKLTYNNIKLVPIENMSEADKIATEVASAPILVDEKAAKKG